MTPVVMSGVPTVIGTSTTGTTTETETATTTVTGTEIVIVITITTTTTNLQKRSQKPPHQGQRNSALFFLSNFHGDFGQKPQPPFARRLKALELFAVIC
jgi:hypothetical protein